MKGCHISFRFLLAVSAVLVGACGGAKSKAPAASSSAHSGSYNASVAEKTSRATAARRGTWSLSSDKVSAVAKLVASNAKKNSLPEDLLFGVIWVESRFNPRAVSPVGARGLMQLMPRTADYLAECIQWDGRKNSFDPEFNISAGSYYIARLIREFKGDENLALAAYNAGPGNVRKWLASGGLPNVSVEYAAMVQTARRFFGASGTTLPTPSDAEGRTRTASVSLEPQQIITNEALDRLGLAILIAGFHDDAFRAEKQDDRNPFD
jgi:hypothetical protein